MQRRAEEVRHVSRARPRRTTASRSRAPTHRGPPIEIVAVVDNGGDGAVFIKAAAAVAVVGVGIIIFFLLHVRLFILKSPWMSVSGRRRASRSSSASRPDRTPLPPPPPCRRRRPPPPPPWPWPWPPCPPLPPPRGGDLARTHARRPQPKRGAPSGPCRRSTSAQRTASFPSPPCPPPPPSRTSPAGSRRFSPSQ